MCFCVVMFYEMSDFKIGLVIGIGESDPEVQDAEGAQLIQLGDEDYVVMLKIKKEKICQNTLALAERKEEVLTAIDKAKMIPGLYPPPQP